MAETGIDGLSADDVTHFLGFSTCGCKHCRADFLRRTGVELPSADDLNFWGNWDNPLWLSWLDMRFEKSSEFYKGLSEVLPNDFILTATGGDSAGAHKVQSCFDGRKNVEGSKYINVELTGNTPPYKKDKFTWNIPIEERFSTASHHQAVAVEKEIRAFGTGFAFTEPTANILWALNKVLGADVWVITLKPRLGLPESVLATLPDEQHIIGKSFDFEAKNKDLFTGELVGQLGVYFSYETRNHTMFGALSQGYSKDFQEALTMLFDGGLCPHTVFDFPDNCDKYPVILVPSPYKMTDEELKSMEEYINAGGNVIVCGPSATNSIWKLENKVPKDTKFFERETNPFKIELNWMKNIELPKVVEGEWNKTEKGLYYNPVHISDMEDTKELFELCESLSRSMPVKIQKANGYLSSMFETEDSYIVHLLVADYDTDIDHLNHTLLQVKCANGICNIILPEKCAYAILKFSK